MRLTSCNGLARPSSPRDHGTETRLNALGPGRLAFARLDAVAGAAVGHGRCLVETMRLTIGEQVSVTGRACIRARQHFRVRLFEMPVPCPSPRDILVHVMTHYTL